MTAPRLVHAVQRNELGKLSGRIAGDAAAVIELLNEAIGAGFEDAGTLNGARQLVARIGALADALSIAHGATNETWHADPLEWLVQDEAMARTLRAIASADDDAPASGKGSNRCAQ